MKIAANLSLLFTELPLLRRVEAAAAAGFDGVELQFPYEVSALELKSALDPAGLPLLLFNLPVGDMAQGGPGLPSVPARQAQFDAALQLALDYARVLRPRWVNVLAGRLAEGLSREVALETLTANLRRAAEAFAELGVGVLAEAINPLDMPGFLINTPEHLQALLAAVAQDNFAVQYDLYHMARQGLDPAAGIALLAGRIGHVQFADCPGRHQPGSGALDFAAALQALRRSGYGGWLAAEYRPSGSTADSLGWLAQWRSDQADLPV
jgi:hydroxypyruvate isomerase